MSSVPWYDRIVPFLFYDLETFGRSPALDRIAEFAGIVTDDTLDLLEQPHELRCIPPADYLAHPGASLTNRITPQDAQATGVAEPVFAERLLGLFFSRPDLRIVGYNSASFDDEFVRYLFYRNLHDPYEWHYRNGNSRLDILAVIPAIFDFMRDRLSWERLEDGKPNFRLESIVNANDAAGGTSHEALADTFALRNVCRLLLDRVPEVWTALPALLERNRKARDLSPGLAVRIERRESPGLLTHSLVYSSAILKREDRSSTIVLPLFADPVIPTKWWLWDLGEDPEALFSWESERHLPRGLFFLNLRRSLALFPPSGDHLETLSAHGLDLLQCERSLKNLFEVGVLKRLSEIRDRLKERAKVFAQKPRDAEEQLYDAFFPDGDRARAADLRAAYVERRRHDFRAGLSTLTDPRLRELGRRMLARHAGSALTSDERERWHSEVVARLDVGAFDKEWRDERSKRAGEHGVSKADRRILDMLLAHRNTVVERFNLADRFGLWTAEW